MSIFNTASEKTVLCKPGHGECSVLFGAVDPNGKHIATTGTDGYLNIYKLNDTQDSCTFVEKFKIIERRVPSDSTIDLKF